MFYKSLQISCLHTYFMTGLYMFVKLLKFRFYYARTIIKNKPIHETNENLREIIFLKLRFLHVKFRTISRKIDILSIRFLHVKFRTISRKIDILSITTKINITSENPIANMWHISSIACSLWAAFGGSWVTGLTTR